MAELILAVIIVALVGMLFVIRRETQTYARARRKGRKAPRLRRRMRRVERQMLRESR